MYAPNDVIKSLWDYFIQAGVSPIGLGARDTLRLEMGYALFGHELTATSFPQETVSAWTIKWKERDFLGKVAMSSRLKSSSSVQRGVVLEEKGVPREKCRVKTKSDIEGIVTSGTFSPSLQKGIAIVQFESQVIENEPVEIQIRDQWVKGKVVSLPFYHKEKK